MGFATIATKGGGGVLGFATLHLPLIRLDFDFDIPSRLIVIVITFYQTSFSIKPML